MSNQNGEESSKQNVLDEKNINPELLIIDSIPEKYQGQKKEINDYEEEVRHHIFPRTPFGTKIRFRNIPKYENNVLALVYFGAAILVLVLGLRGLGTQIPGFLEFLTDSKGRVSSWVIFPALILECTMIGWLAATMLFKLEEHDGLFSLLRGKKQGEDNMGLPNGKVEPLTEELKVKQITCEILELSQNKPELCNKIIEQISKNVENSFENIALISSLKKNP